MNRLPLQISCFRLHRYIPLNSTKVRAVGKYDENYFSDWTVKISFTVLLKEVNDKMVGKMKEISREEQIKPF